MTGSAVRARAYERGVLVAESLDVRDLEEWTARPDTLVWVDVSVPAGTEVLHELGRRLGLSDLVVEDAVSRHERPKFDEYEGYDFVNVYVVRRDAAGDVQTLELSAVVMPAVLVTVGVDAAVGAGALASRWQDHPHLLKHGPAALLYVLLDLVVDGYFAVVQALDEEMDAIEDDLFEDHAQRSTQERTFRLRKHLVRLRRGVLPMREVVAALVRREDGETAETAVLRPHYQDLYDHVLRVTEWSDDLREMVTTAFETNLSLQDRRLNTIIKKLTSWAAIIAVPTAITGFFGQNVTFPGEGSWSGLVLSTLLIALTAGGLYALFRRRDWI